MQRAGVGEVTHEAPPRARFVYQILTFARDGWYATPSPIPPFASVLRALASSRLTFSPPLAPIPKPEIRSEFRYSLPFRPSRPSFAP